MSEQLNSVKASISQRNAEILAEEWAGENIFVHDWANDEVEPVHYPPACDEMFPTVGLSLVAAAPKAGKSTLAAEMAIRLSRGSGKDEWGNTELPREVMIIANEGVNQTRSRLKRWQYDREGGEKRPAPPNKLMLVGNDKAEELMEEEGLVTLKDLVGNGLQVIFIDSLVGLMDIKNENDASEVRTKLKPLKKLAEDGRILVVLLHHTSKNNSGQHQFSSRGSSDIPALVDESLVIERTKNNKGEKVASIKCTSSRNDARREGREWVFREDWGYGLRPDKVITADDEKMAEYRKAVPKDGEWFHYDDLDKEELPSDVKRTVQKWLNKLVENEELKTKEGPGRRTLYKWVVNDERE